MPFFGSLILVALLSFRLVRSKLENDQLTEKQKTLAGQIAAVSKRPVKRDSAETKSAGKQKTESSGDNKLAPSLEADSWRKRREAFRHRDVLRVAWFRYHEAMAKLNLTHEKQVQLLDLLRDREEGWFDAKEAAISLGIGDPQEINQALAAARNSMSEKIAALIGDSGLETLDSSLVLKAQEGAISGGVGADLAMDGIPLTPEQETGLAQICADVSKQFPTGSTSGSNPQQSANSEAAVLEKAAAILTPDQMADLKVYIDWSNQRATILADRPRYPTD